MTLKPFVQKAIVCLSMMSVLSCSLPVRELTQEALEANATGFATTYQVELDHINHKSTMRLMKEYGDTQPHTYDVLVLSGGGPLGAFGAGFLQGWGESESPDYTRPVFDSVSGVSTGALIAPFAFVGSDTAYQEIVDLYSNPDENLIIPRTILGFLAGHGAYYDATGLHKRIKRSITPELVSEIAQGAKDNRVLMVGATNLDYGTMRVWDIAEFAKMHAFEDSHHHITQKLAASSAIPSAFPPVLIDNYLYVDGGASMQIVSGIDDRQWLYDSSLEEFEFVEPNRPLKIRIWVIINNKLTMEPEVTSPVWSSIAERSLFTLMRGSTLQTLQDMETYAQMINKLDYFDVQMQYVAIPQSFVIPETQRMFDKEKMKKLVALGQKMGRDPSSWQKKTLRPGAPFQLPAKPNSQ